MFSSPASRFALRASLVGVGALLSSLAASTYGSDLQLGEIILAVSSGFGAGLAYAGLGGASKAIEPNVGNKA
jgi:hypothetical protein